MAPLVLLDTQIHCQRPSRSKCVAFFYDLEDSFEVFLGELGSRRQTEPAIEKVFAHLPSPDAAILKHRLQVHRFLSET